MHALDLLVPEAGAIYVMDRAYVDFERLSVLNISRSSIRLCSISSFSSATMRPRASWDLSRLYLAGRTMVPTHNTEIIGNTVGFHIDREGFRLRLAVSQVETANDAAGIAAVRDVRHPAAGGYSHVR